MKTSTLLVITVVLLLLVFHKGAANHIKLLVRQPLIIKATIGDTVTFSCFFETESPSFTVRWTLCCEQLITIFDHPSYKNRVNLTSTFKEVTIVNVTEEDSEKYCCEVLTADFEKGVGKGTFLEVAPHIEKEKEECSVETICILIEATRLVSLAIIIILLGVIVKKLS